MDIIYQTYKLLVLLSNNFRYDDTLQNQIVMKIFHFYFTNINFFFFTFICYKIILNNDTFYIRWSKYLNPINFRAPLIFAHHEWAKINRVRIPPISLQTGIRWYSTIFFTSIISSYITSS